MKGQGNVCLLLLILINAVVFVGLLVLNYLAGDPSNSGGLFIHGIGNVSAIYNLEVTPAGATFAIWGVIYLWQFLWIIYSLVAICRSTPDGPVYTTPMLLPVGFFITYILNMITNGVWLFLWDREYVIASVFVLLATSVTLYVCIGISYRFLQWNILYLSEHGRTYDVYLVRYVVQNGLGIYAAWVTIATLLNLGAVLEYKLENPLDSSTTALIILSLLSVEVVVFVALDLSVLYQYSRYIFTPYLVVVVALVGIIAKNWDPLKSSSIFSAVLLGVAAVCLCLKFATLLGRTPQNRQSIQPTLTERTPILG
ncbi:uncharacterized protein LOC124114661 [Haliotis rufescens]|uniref:uncharacterized protein LOC124114661 n=1 Tax=Haliotis rufescens TaxID=6454 RepID=UPI00201F34B5|nr:uncharacterized protein LOC124114661 [Haliotis rufescens]